MKKEFKRIKKVSKEIIEKKHYNKIKKLKNYEDKTESLKYLAASKLQLTLLELEAKIKEINHKKTRLMELKLSLLPSKIKIFKSTFNKRDYDVIKRLVKEIEEELENV